MNVRFQRLRGAETDMHRGEAPVRRRTLELHRRIWETARPIRGRAGANAVLFVDRGPPVFPVRVLRDTVLEPVDKVVWMVLRRSGAKGRFPRHAQIARIANVSSKSTVSRALAILRAERWLSLCVEGEPRSRGGRRAVYALHDEPLPLADAVYLDAGYVAFLRLTRAHSHARARRVARRVLAGLEGIVEAAGATGAAEDARVGPFGNGRRDVERGGPKFERR